MRRLRNTALAAVFLAAAGGLRAVRAQAADGRADTSGADLVVFVLRTPGGLLDSTRTIVSRMITSRAPVMVFVGPSGARAASAGFVIALAADVTVMAPGTHIGAAHPVSGSGAQPDETTAQKAASDTAAYARSLAEARGRNLELAEDAVLESRAFTNTEALEGRPLLIDFLAPDHRSRTCRDHAPLLADAHGDRVGTELDDHLPAPDGADADDAGPREGRLGGRRRTAPLARGPSVASVRGANVHGYCNRNRCTRSP